MTAGGPGSGTADLTYAAEGDIGLITLDRPEARNALTWQMYAELERVVRSTTARCLVITGADPAFCSGDDVRQVMGGGERPPRRRPSKGCLDSPRRPTRCCTRTYR